MKIIFSTLPFLLVLFLLNACQDETPTPIPQSDSINKIMPLGASRVEGFQPLFESYRYELWKDLKENNWTFDFIGTRTDRASYPSLNGENFDPDHEGRSGWTSAEILEGLDAWLEQTGAPDVVLFSSPGGNDILNGGEYSQTLSNINSIIDLLQANNPNITILIEQAAPGRSSFMTPEFTNAFIQMQQDVATIAREQSSTTSQIIAVDMFTGFSDSLLADDVHYNQAGADFIAERYYSVLSMVLEN